MHPRICTAVLVALLVGTSCQSTSRPRPLERPALADPYLDLMVTYCTYARTIWRESDVGGFWGPGISESNPDGGVRGMGNTALAYAFLVRAMDEQWLASEHLPRLDAEGLDRSGLLDHVKKNLSHLAAHHVSSTAPRLPPWGLSSRSAMWSGAWGAAALLVWNDLPTELQSQLSSIAATEADRVVAEGAAHPGEENASQTLTPAVALGLNPSHPHARQWLRAMNGCADKSFARQDIFQPETLQLAGAHLGEAWLWLQVGDRMNGTDFAPQFAPHALHGAKEVWQSEVKPLVLANGELAFPTGNDGIVNSSMGCSYFAYVATGLGDGSALAAAKALPEQALRHREHSAPGRILGDTNLEWWAEPLLVQRMCVTLLQFAMRPVAVKEPGELGPAHPVKNLWPDAKVWMYRNDRYLASASWGARKMGTFTALNGGYLTLPTHPGILPTDLDHFVEQFEQNEAQVLVLESANKQRAVVVCLPRSVVWISAGASEPLGIQNDPLSGPRTLYFNDVSKRLPAVEFVDPFSIPGKSLNIDNKLALVSTGEGFSYTHASDFNRKSAAVDWVVPMSSWGAWQMTPDVKNDQTWRLAHAFGANFDGHLATVTVQDGPTGRRYRIRAVLTPPFELPTQVTSQKASSSVSVDRVD